MGSLLKERIDLEPVLLILLFPFLTLGSVGKSNPTGTLLKKGSDFIRLLEPDQNL